MKRVIGVAIATALLTGCTVPAESAVIKTCSSKQVNVVKNGQVCKKVGTIYRWINVPKAKATPTAKNVSNYSVLLSSFADVNKYVYAENYRFPLENIKFGPHLDPVIVKNSKDVYSYIGSVFSSFYAPNYYYAIVTSELDKDWAASPEINKIDRSFTGLYGNTCENGNGGNEWSSISCTWSNKTDWDRLELLAHEYTHSVLYTVGGSKTGRVTDYNRVRLIPSWLNEGAATYYGWWLASQRSLDIKKHISNHLGGFSCMVKDYGNITSPEKLKEQMIYIEKGPDGIVTDSSFKQYGYGAIAVANLIANYGGHKAMLHFYTNLRSTDDWKLAFKDAFGITPDEFYMAQYNDFVKMLPDLQKGC